MDMYCYICCGCILFVWRMQTSRNGSQNCGVHPEKMKWSLTNGVKDKFLLRSRKGERKNNQKCNTDFHGDFQVLKINTKVDFEVLHGNYK